MATLCSFAAEAGAATDGDRLYLSGTDRSDAVSWDFRIDAGRQAGVWSTLPVPSQWELEGFGDYRYGMDSGLGPGEGIETGRYRRNFEVPVSWSGQRVRLVFEGVMTDTTVWLNGRPAGPTHRGGFTEFSYDVSHLLAWGAENEIEVEVAEASADRSVDRAERRADYWLFGGIYRSVYLEATPARSISHVAIDARHDGELAIAVELFGVRGGELLEARVYAEGGEGVELGTALATGVAAGRASARLEGRVPGIRPWSSESPVLYRLELNLFEGSERLHTVSRKIGFRTVELRRDGLFINGRRRLLKGVNRHSFWPESGRALTAERNRRDVELLKLLNANAVRTAHYPPDRAFLEACDELGLYVIDELPGWHDAYRAGPGARLIAEMVRRDVNHPSVILWANGNEGGWNSLLDAQFERHDLQRRSVLHPGSIASGVNALHYPSWSELTQALAGGDWIARVLSGSPSGPNVLPTEMLHGLYDGGSGASLAAYWKKLSTPGRGLGGFLWSLFDEGVVRSDRDGAVDTHGNYAPDGILGPFREPEASFETVRSVWSPVSLERASWSAGQVELVNRYVETDLVDIEFLWQGVLWPGPDAEAEETVVTETPAKVAGPPGETVVAQLATPLDPTLDALRLVASDGAGRELSSWAGWIRPRAERLEAWLPAAFDGTSSAAAAPAWVDSTRVLGEGESEGEVRWRVHPSGWARLEFPGDLTLRVVDFEPLELGWVGGGPWPVWANRLDGARLGLWRRELDDGARGFYSGVDWMKMRGRAAELTLIVESPGLFVGVTSPRFPDDAKTARAELASLETVSFLRRIPAIGTKFHAPEALGFVPRESEAEPASSVVWLRLEPIENP